MIKRWLPKTLFGRALLIVVLPTVLVQLVSAYIFYVRHWESVAKHMANALAGEIAFLSYEAVSMPPRERESLMWTLEATTGIRAEFIPQASLPRLMQHEENDFKDFRRLLAERTDLPFTVQRVDDGNVLEIRMQLADGVLSLRTTPKRLESGTTLIFMLWMTGSSCVFLCIAILFLRNQVRPIRELAEAAESFGKGRDLGDFKPHGAQEVRRAARAFLVMRERIRRQIRSRTEMLAGISHDLRTPLTRMRLEIAMLGDVPAAGELMDDVTQMEHMIAEYLDFARGDGGEETVAVKLSELLSSIAEDYRRLGHAVPVSIAEDVTLALRAGAFRRMMHNLIDNALRYGVRCRVSTGIGNGKLEIRVDDDGPGIPEAQREEVFRPFTRLDTSRNPKTGGVGLGLSIARDVARAAGGNIRLTDAPGGGLRVMIGLPL